MLETVFSTPEGSIAVIDFMAANVEHSTVVRIIEGREGRVAVQMDLTLRFDYGSSVPWVSKLSDATGIVAIAGPNLAVLRTTVPLRGEDLSTTAAFEVSAGQRIAFTLSYGLSHRPPPAPLDAEIALRPP